MSVYETGNEPATLGIDDPCMRGNQAFAGRSSADDPISSHQRYGISDRTAAGAIPEVGTYYCDRGIRRGSFMERGHSPAAGAQNQGRNEGKQKVRTGPQLHGALLALAGARHGPCWGVASTGTYFKMRGKDAFGRDSQAGLHGDQEHYACCG